MGAITRLNENTHAYPLFTRVEDGYLLKGIYNVRVATIGTFSTEAAGYSS